MPSNTNIDPAESLLAAIGVRPIISHEIEQITAAQWKATMDIGVSVRRAIRLLLNNKLTPAPDLDPVLYKKTLHDLTSPYKPAQVEAMLMHIPPQLDIHASFVILAHKAFEFLRFNFPLSVQQDLGKAVNLVPARSLLWQFESILQILDNPLLAFNLMVDGSISARQCMALSYVYPTLFKFMDMQLRTTAPGTDPKPATKHGIYTFLNVEAIPADLDASLQQPTPQAQQAPPKPTNNKSDSGKLVSTFSQKIDNSLQ